MEKEKLTLKEKFDKYSGRVFCVINPNVEGSTYIKFRVVGYQKRSDNYLIGKLVGGLGITHHFLEPRENDFVVNHKSGNNYYYVNLRMIEKYPEVKKVIAKKDRIEDINVEDFKFF